jgi:membrane protease YdiL (CAAX protease family)
VLWVVLGKVLSETVLAIPLLVATWAAGGSGELQAGQFELMDASRVGLPLWSFFLGVIGWGELLVTIAITAGCAVWLEKKRLGDLGLRRTPYISRDFLVGMALSAVLFISVIGFGAGRGLYEVLPRAHGWEVWIISVVGFLILLPFAAVEEIVMRGYLLQAVRRSWGTEGAVVVSTVAFTVLHAANPGFADNPLAMVGLALAGFYLASAYLITGDLWLAIFLHTGWNLMQGPVFGAPVSGAMSPASVFVTRAWGESHWTGGSFGPEAGLLLCGLMLVHLGALWALRPLLGRTPVEAAPPAPPASSGGSEPPATGEYRAIPIPGGSA